MVDQSRSEGGKVHTGTQTGSLEDEDDDDSSLSSYQREEQPDYEDRCVICLDKWTKYGRHMATSLSCGHVFGLRCIKRWVNLARNCPLCKAFSHKYHMKGVYHSLGTYFGHSSNNTAADGRQERRLYTRRRRQAARSELQMEIRLAGDERLREDAEGAGSQ